MFCDCKRLTTGTLKDLVATLWVDTVFCGLSQKLALLKNIIDLMSILKFYSFNVVISTIFHDFFYFTEFIEVKLIPTNELLQKLNGKGLCIGKLKLL